MIITFFHIPAPGMGSLLSDSFGKEVGKRKWCETFAGPLARRLSRSGGLSEFHFFQRNADFLVRNSYHKKAQEKHNSYHKKNTNHTTEKAQTKTQVIPQKKHKNKHKSYHKKTHTKKTHVIPQKSTKNTSQTTKKAQTKITSHTTKKEQKKHTSNTTKKHKQNTNPARFQPVQS